jgi:SnoaL-like domain
VIDPEHSRDEREIAALLNTYARAVDTKDWVLYRSVFTEDAFIDYSSAGVIAGSLDEVTDFFAGDFSALVLMSMHYITNVESDITGDTARVRAMFYNPTRIQGVAQLCLFGGYYHHELVRTADGWRSRHLREESVWTVNAPAKAQPSAAN